MADLRDRVLSERVRYVHAVDGARLAITEVFSGAPTEGPSVLLLHGFAQNRRTFLAGPMPAGFVGCGARVFVGEFRGHGLSDRPTTPWNLEAHLSLDLPCLIDAVADRTGTRPHVVGHSMAGMLGYAALADGFDGRSLTTLCAPMILGATRSAVRAASLLAPVIAATSLPVPMDRFLRLVSRPLTRPKARFGLGAFQRFTSLVNPRLATRSGALEVLRNAEPESPLVLKQIAEMGVTRRPILMGVDLADAVFRSPLPVCVVVGTHDVFAPPASVAPFNRVGHGGRRRLVQIPGGSHVDLPIGHHAYRLAEDLWRFIESS